MAAGISIHCVDVANGQLAVGLLVEMRRLSPSGEPLADPLLSGRVSSNGLLEHPLLMSDAMTAGGYEVTFHVGEYYRARGDAVPTPAFLEKAPYRFHTASTDQHYHLPFKFTAWGFSLFRGGA